MVAEARIRSKATNDCQKGADERFGPTSNSEKRERSQIKIRTPTNTGT